MIKLKHISLILLGAMTLCFSGCYYDKYDDLNPKVACDTTSAITYSSTIKPIIDQNCTNCHMGPTPSGGVNLETYTAVKAQASQGKLYSSITWDGTSQKMPQNSSTKISDCSIIKIKKWMDSNYPQ